MAFTCNDRVTEVARAARRPVRRPWLYAAALMGVDIALWFGLYLGISAVVSNNYGMVDLILPVAVLVASAGLVGGYNSRSDFMSLKFATEHIIACTSGLLVAAVLLYVVATFGGGVASSRGVLFLSIAGFTALTLAHRRSALFASSVVWPRRRILVIADENLGERFYDAYKASGQPQRLHIVSTNPNLVGRVVDFEQNLTYATSTSDLAQLLAETSDDEFEAIVVAADGDNLEQEVLSILATVHFQEMPVYSVRGFYEAYWQKMPAHLLTPTWPLQAGFHLVKHSVFASAKRVVDIVLSFIALVLLSPVLGTVALAVKLDSRGPILFRQTRVGQHRQPFSILKFRTMFVGSEKLGMYTAERDPRITRVGAFLRKTRLDELPQLFNVLRGDMSLIGPRAEWIRCVEEYEKVIPHYHFRHLVRPGITGWAQVNYPYGASLEDTVEKLMYDLYYIRNFSMNLDAAVILKTLHVVSFGKGR